MYNWCYQAFLTIFDRDNTIDFLILTDLRVLFNKWPGASLARGQCFTSRFLGRIMGCELIASMIQGFDRSFPDLIPFYRDLAPQPWSWNMPLFQYKRNLPVCLAFVHQSMIPYIKALSNRLPPRESREMTSSEHLTIWAIMCQDAIRDNRFVLEVISGL